MVKAQQKLKCTEHGRRTCMNHIVLTALTHDTMSAPKELVDLSVAHRIGGFKSHSLEEFITENWNLFTLMAKTT